MALSYLPEHLRQLLDEADHIEGGLTGEEKPYQEDDLAMAAENLAFAIQEHLDEAHALAKGFAAALAQSTDKKNSLITGSTRNSLVDHIAHAATDLIPLLERAKHWRNQRFSPVAASSLGSQADGSADAGASNPHPAPEAPATPKEEVMA
ncbi:MAG: hypothetical protein AAFR65_11155 [Pseudomonadota bacterium]